MRRVTSNALAVLSIALILRHCLGAPAADVLAQRSAIAGTITDSEGKPVAGARVVAFKELGRKGGDDLEWLLALVDQEALGRPQALAMTDREGRFSLSGVEREGVYAVRAVATGFCPAEEESVDAGSRDVKIVLAPGWPLSGRVLTEGERPVGGALIEAHLAPGTTDLRKAIANRLRGSVDSTTSAADGRFEFKTLGGGAFVLLATAPGCQDGTLDVDLRRRMEKAITITLKPGLSLAGTVRGAGGEPVAGAAVKVRSQSTQAELPSPIMRREERATSTDAAGRFAFDTLGPGTYTVIVNPNDWAPAHVTDVSVPSTDLKISVEKGGTLTGRVTDREGKPLPGARVVVYDPSGIERAAVTDGEGRYRIPHISRGPPRKKRVVVEKEGYQRITSSVELAPGTTELDLAGGQTTADLALDRCGSISGIVLDSRGQPVSGMTTDLGTLVLSPEEEKPDDR